MLTNLLSNAIKFSSQGADILVAAGHTADGGQYLSVRDHGCGMDAAVLAAATEAFSRGASTANVEGFGLGLSIVRQLVEAHQGDLVLQSTAGHGTLASVAFPPSRVTDLPGLGLHANGSEMTLPLSPENAMPFVPGSIEIETQETSQPSTSRSGHHRLAEALKRRARKVANDDERRIQEHADADLQIEALLEAEIIGALSREGDRHKAANAA
nr:ATP-binding protein [Marinicella sp. W31]MDC2876639.1 ATP-binding protein [Marinicella sp. W31]